jgi:enoyl-[acyl-carrier protein] reductase II
MTSRCIGKALVTRLMLKKLAPTRLAKNEFFNEVEEAENRGATPEEMRELLGRGRAKKGIFEGDLMEGELEIGQVSAIINECPTVDSVMHQLISSFNETAARLSDTRF